MTNMQDALEYVDGVVFKKTGKHLDDLQAAVIMGVLQRKKYSEIAKSLQISLGYTKDIGYELWEMLSEDLGEEVNKSNLVATLLRKGIIGGPSINDVFGYIGHNVTVRTVRIGKNLVNVQQSTDGGNSEFTRDQKELDRQVSEKLHAMGLTHDQIESVLDLISNELNF
jgi:hypothetical protein